MKSRNSVTIKQKGACERADLMDASGDSLSTSEKKRSNAPDATVGALCGTPTVTIPSAK